MIPSITTDRESKYTLLPLSSYLVAVIENLPREDNSNSSVPCRVAGVSRTQPCAASGHQRTTSTASGVGHHYVERVQAGEVEERESSARAGERQICRGERAEEQADMNDLPATSPG